MHAKSDTIALTHHATLLRGDFDHASEALERALGFEFRSAADPDISYIRKDALSIDDARNLSERALQKPVRREHMTFIVAVDSINSEAQNALLKLTEDPPAHARFIFILPQSAPIFGTLRSRFNMIDIADTKGRERARAESLSVLMKDIARMAKDKDDAGMELLLREAEAFVRTHPKSRASASLLLARRYIESRGSSPKMLLEHLAISERE